MGDTIVVGGLDALLTGDDAKQPANSVAVCTELEVHAESDASLLNVPCTDAIIAALDAFSQDDTTCETGCVTELDLACDNAAKLPCKVLGVSQPLQSDTNQDSV